MSILGYSTSYYLPEYWAETPLYGEKIIALLDEVLSLNYSRSEGLAEVYYNIADKYKNTQDLSVQVLEELIAESGYSYIRDLVGDDVSSLVLLVYLLPMIHQYKGTKTGLEAVLNLLRKDTNTLKYSEVGSLITHNEYISGFSENDYAYLKGLRGDDFSFEILTKICTGEIGVGQCIFSSDNYGFNLSLSAQGNLLLSLGNDGTSWNIADGVASSSLLSSNKIYYIKFIFNRYSYSVAVSEDGVNFNKYIEIENSTALDIHSGKIYLGINGSSRKEPVTPFLGSISKEGTFVAVNNMIVTEWFEQLPVAEENTFKVRTDLDTSITSSDFFDKFFNFTSKYVYPTLTEFEATLSYAADVAVISYAKQKMTYVCSGVYGMTEPFEVKVPEEEGQWEDFLVSLGTSGDKEIFETIVDESTD